MNLILLILLLTPNTVTVRITGTTICKPGQSYTTEIVDFQEYVKDVLPNEWGRDWPEESLKAGAVAVKQFAIYEYRAQGYLWDCNYDQVYRTGWRTEATDRAIEDSWNTWVPGVGRTYFNAWMNGCRFQGENCMGQWKSKEIAERGWNFEEILLMFYEGEIYTLHFSRLDWNLEYSLLTGGK